MTKAYNPFEDEDDVPPDSMDAHYKALMELRATCLDAPLNLGFLTRRLRARGMFELANDIDGYANDLAQKAKAADVRSESAGG